VINRPAYDLASAAPEMVDCILAGLVARPPRRAAHSTARSSTRRRWSACALLRVSAPMNNVGAS
jgi:hypothetical protein